MAAEYQEPDWRVADYQLYCLDEAIIDPSRSCPLRIRGPRPQHLGRHAYFVCLGAAQTFGRFCETPFPSLLAQRIGYPVINISHGGAGPSFFCGDNARLLDYLNQARFVIVQVMSGRSASNSLFESNGVGHYKRRSDGTFLGCDEAFATLLKTRSRRGVARIVRETRQSWFESYRSLLGAIQAPKILFWFSTRHPDYRLRYNKGVAGLFGAYPQLVDANLLAQIRGFADHTVLCVTQRGLPQKLHDRFTGELTMVSDEWTSQPWAENWYYPSPAMHQDAANALEPAARVFAGIGDLTP